MGRFLKLIAKLIVFIIGVGWGFKHYHAHKTAEAVQGRSLSDGQYSTPAAQNQPHLIVYGIPCIATRK